MVLKIIPPCISPNSSLNLRPRRNVSFLPAPRIEEKSWLCEKQIETEKFDQNSRQKGDRFLELPCDSFDDRCQKYYGSEPKLITHIRQWEREFQGCKGSKVENCVHQSKTFSSCADASPQLIAKGKRATFSCRLIVSLGTLKDKFLYYGPWYMIITKDDTIPSPENFIKPYPDFEYRASEIQCYMESMTNHQRVNFCDLLGL